MAVLARAQARLRAECVAAGKRELYLELGEIDGTVPREFRSFRPATKAEGESQATFSPHNRLIASLSHGGVLLWEAGSGRQLARLSATESKCVRFHPQGDALIVSSHDQINPGSCSGKILMT